MKRLRVFGFLLLFSSLAFSQGAIVPPQNALKVVNGIVMPIANAAITVCAANASGIPCAPALANTVFSDAALTQPLSNPFPADANGNYQFAVAPNTYTVTVTATGFSGYSYQITVQCLSGANCTFTGPVNFNAGGTLNGNFGGNPNFIGNVIFSGNPVFSGNASVTGSLVPSGTGSIVGSGSIVKSTGIPAPTPLATVACPSGQTPFQYILKADGTYQDVASLDITTVNNPASPAGTINNCWRTQYNDSGTAGGLIKNSMVNVLHVMGHGGIKEGSTLQQNAFSSRIDNSDAGSAQTWNQAVANYNEAVITHFPTFGGHAAGETDVSGVRASVGDNRDAGTGADGIWAGVSAQLSRSTSAQTGGGGIYTGMYSYVQNTNASAPVATTSFNGYTAVGSDIGPCSGSGCSWVGFSAPVPSNKFANSNAGARIGNFGTGTNDYDLRLDGVNASGTAAGFNYAIGPFSMGNTTKCGAGVQVCVTGGQTKSDTFGTTTNCAGTGTAANPSVVTCTSASAGAVACSASASTGTCVVNTTAVTANSEVFIQPTAASASLTCNATADTGLTAPRLASISTGTSFTINLGTFTTTAECFKFEIKN